MTREEYAAMSDDELVALYQKGDSEAWYYWYLRHRDGRMIGVASNCGNRADDNDYYGSPEEGNR